jgi:hypothetical protein
MRLDREKLIRFAVSTTVAAGLGYGGIRIVQSGVTDAELNDALNRNNAILTELNNAQDAQNKLYAEFTFDGHSDKTPGDLFNSLTTEGYTHPFLDSSNSPQIMGILANGDYAAKLESELSNNSSKASENVISELSDLPQNVSPNSTNSGEIIYDDSQNLEIFLNPNETVGFYEDAFAHRLSDFKGDEKEGIDEMRDAYYQIQRYFNMTHVVNGESKDEFLKSQLNRMSEGSERYEYGVSQVNFILQNMIPMIRNYGVNLQSRLVNNELNTRTGIVIETGLLGLSAIVLLKRKYTKIKESIGYIFKRKRKNKDEEDGRLIDFQPEAKLKNRPNQDNPFQNEEILDFAKQIKNKK